MSLGVASRNSQPLAFPPPLGLEKELSYVGLLARNAAFVSFIPEGPYNAGQIAYVDFPNTMMDLRKAFLHFTVTGTPGTGSTYNRFNFDIRSIIKRVEVLIGSRVVVDISNFNVLSNMLNNLMDVNLFSTVGQISGGTGSQAQRNAAFANSTYDVQMYHFNTSFFQSILPLQKLATNVRLRLTFANANECIETDGTNPTYVVSNLQFHYNVLIPDEKFNSLWDSKIRGDGIHWTYETFSNFQTTNLLANGTNNATQILNYKFNSLLGVLMVMRDSANIYNFAANDKLNKYNYNGLNLFRLRISSQSYPIDPSRSIGDLYFALIETFGISARFPTYGSTNYGSSSFIAGVPLAKHTLENRDGADIGGLATVLGTSILCDMGFSSPLDGNNTVDFFSIQHNTITFLPNGSIEWNE